jgi:hypothetical protein
MSFGKIISTLLTSLTMVIWSMVLFGCSAHSKQQMMADELFQTSSYEQSQTKPLHRCQIMYHTFKMLDQQHQAYLAYLRGEPSERHTSLTRAEVEAAGFITEYIGETGEMKRVKNLEVATGDAAIDFLRSLGNSVKPKSPEEWAFEMSIWVTVDIPCVDKDGERPFIYINRSEESDTGFQDYYRFVYRGPDVMLLSRRTTLPYSKTSTSAPGLGIIKGMDRVGDIAVRGASEGIRHGIRGGL